MNTISTTTTNSGTYTIKFNGSNTYFVINEVNDAIFRTNTIRKANNFIKKA